MPRKGSVQPMPSGNNTPSSCSDSEASSSRSSPSCCERVFVQSSVSERDSRSRGSLVRAKKPKRAYVGRHRSFSARKRGSPRKALHKIAARKLKKAARWYLELEFERELVKELRQVKALEAQTTALEEANREMELQLSTMDKKLRNMKQTVYQHAVITTVVTSLVLNQEISTAEFEYEYEQFL